MRIRTNDINVRDYGAAGDGVTDDSPAFDAALLAMQNANTSRGNKLVIPNGVFRLTHELNVECCCIIEGSGVGEESAGTILRFEPAIGNGLSGFHGVIVNSTRGSVTQKNPSWTIVRDLTIMAANMDTAFKNRNGFTARSRFKLENVNILNFTGNGVHIVTGDGNNSDGNTLWMPGKLYTVGDWVKEPGFNRRVIISQPGITNTMTLNFNPAKSGDTGNIFDVEIVCNNPWAHTPVDGDVMIIPANSVLAENNPENAGAYVLLVPQNGQYVAITPKTFRAAKYADDPFIASNGIKKNPVSVGPVQINADTDIQIFTNLGNRYCCSTQGFSSPNGEGPGEVRLNYHSASINVLPKGNVKGLKSGATAKIISDHGIYVVITNSKGAFLNEQITFTSGGRGTAYTGEFRLNYLGTGGTHIGDIITGGTSGAKGKIIDDHGSDSFLVYTPINGIAFQTKEDLTFAATNPGVAKTTSDSYIGKGSQYHSIGLNIPDDLGGTGTARWTQTTPGTPNDMGNANNFLVVYVRVAGCGFHGMFIEGDNVNAGTTIDFDASVNGGWGIFDNSFLGNTHIGPHAEANDKGAYRTANHGNAHNVFIGCYSEGDNSPPSKIYNPGISIGGIMAGGFAIDSSGFRLDGSSMTPHSVTINQPDQLDIRLNYTAGIGSRKGIVTQGSVTATVLKDHNDSIEITHPVGGEFVDGLGLVFSDVNGVNVGTAVASGPRYFANKEMATIIGRSSVGGGIFSGINFVHSDDYIGVSLGTYNRVTDSWEFGRINSGPSYSFLGGKFRNGFQVGGIFVRGGTGAAGVGVGVGQSILCSNGYPLNFNQNRNGFYPGQLILNQNTGSDGIVGWICKEKCGSGTPWHAEEFTDPVSYFITPSPGHPQFNNGFVYRKHESSTNNYTGANEPLHYPEIINDPQINNGLLTESTGIVWECFGYTKKGLEEIVTIDTRVLPDDTLTPGTVTQNNTRGRVAVPGGSTSDKVTVMNTYVNPVSCIFATIQTIDPTCNQIIAIVPGTGEFTIYFNKPATSKVNVCWKLEK